MRLRIPLVVLLGVLLPWIVAAQTGSDFYAYPKSFKDVGKLKLDLRQLTFSRLPGISSDYKIGPGDELAIEVVDLPDFSRNVKVSNTGVMTMPLLGSMDVNGLTAAEIESKLAGQLKDQNLVQNPEVLVDVVDYAAKPIYILGEVDKAGEYVMSQQLTLMDAILLAGGLDITAARYGYLHRRLDPQEPLDLPPDAAAPPESRSTPVFNVLQRQAKGPLPSVEKPDVALPGTEVSRVDLDPLKKGGLLQPNTLLRRGDVFIVPRRNVEVLYIIGEVKRPGAFEVRPEESLLVSQAIAQAGGPSQTAKMSEGLLVRYDDAGKRIERKVDFGAVLAAKEPDFKVLPDDVIFIPGSKSKTLAYGLLGIVPQTVQQGVDKSMQR